MCGRFTHMFTWRELYELYAISLAPPPEDLKPSHNVAPTQSAPIVRDNNSRREAALLRWGLIPSWAKDAKIGSNLINARAETVAEKPAFRSAFKRRRCIVPISGFYEWQAGADPKSPKTPHYIHRADGAIMSLAGMWESWSVVGAAPVETFTIITTSANEFMSRLHDRMPVVLEPERIGAWLDPEAHADSLSALMCPAAEGVLTAHPVSRRVNSPKNNDADLVARAV